jgi:hypothetical protein
MPRIPGANTRPDFNFGSDRGAGCLLQFTEHADVITDQDWLKELDGIDPHRNHALAGMGSREGAIRQVHLRRGLTAEDVAAGIRIAG